MRVSFIVTLALLLLCQPRAYSQINCGVYIPPSELAFGDGEHLQYSVNYSLALVKASVADVTIRTTSQQLSQKECFRIEAQGKTRPFYSIFFEMNDTYHSWLEKSTLLPLKSTSNLHEGDYRFRSTYDYDWTTRTVHTIGTRVREGYTKAKTMSLANCGFDALSMFYNLRNYDISNLKYGETVNLPLVLDDTVRQISFRILAHEIKKIKGMGTFRTIKIACKFVTSTDESFQDGTEFMMWVSDDKNRIPIYMESPIRVGSVSVTLTSWSNLQHPVSSIVVTK